jgi:S1-C subfamily serine protease
MIDGEVTPFQVLKRDKESNLALVKVEKTNLPTASYFPLENLQLGERIFLVGNLSAKKIVNEGIVRSFTADLIETNIIDNAEAVSSPVFDIEGNILGLSQVAKDGRVTVLPVAKIKAVSGL